MHIPVAPQRSHPLGLVSLLRLIRIALNYMLLHQHMRHGYHKPIARDVQTKNRRRDSASPPTRPYTPACLHYMLVRRIAFPPACSPVRPLGKGGQGQCVSVGNRTRSTMKINLPVLLSSQSSFAKRGFLARQILHRREFGGTCAAAFPSAFVRFEGSVNRTLKSMGASKTNLQPDDLHVSVS